MLARFTPTYPRKSPLDPRRAAMTTHETRREPPRECADAPQLLIVYGSPLTISSAYHPLFRVLFTFPSRYFFAIGLAAVFSFG